MSGRGRHRRPRDSRLNKNVTRISVVAAAGGVTTMVAGANAQAASVSTWDKVAECESSGDWSINTGNGYYGGLQFAQSTWEGFGGSKYASRADQASKSQQIDIAEKVLAEQGPGAWPLCGPKAGLAKGGPAPGVDPGGESKPTTPAKPKAPSKPERPKGDQASSHGRNGESYTVASGDTLFKIAKAQDVQGGWEALYEDNRQVIGGDPDVIIPGQKLSVDGGPAKSESKATPKKSGPKHAKPKQSSDQASAPSGNSSGFQAPVNAPTSTAYRASGGSWSSGYHTGVDFSVSSGTSVKAVGQGTVVSAGWGGSYGNQVVIKHSDGRYSQYAHLSSLSVSAGQTVSGGQQLGLSGSTGNSTGPHLHFEIRTGPDYGSDIDPLAYLRGKGVSL
ncbi:transglycosylase family protein [Streptomyces sp. NPDC005438]|uniref:transglycosylase family protein n=1 Tax=Streptomyces sp. NPDC005438 TaxID=3156880 RepID=UPI0033BDEC71